MKHATCQQQKCKVHHQHSTIFPGRNARHSTLHIVLLFYQPLHPTTVKSPCCPTLKDIRHYSTKSSRRHQSTTQEIDVCTVPISLSFLHSAYCPAFPAVATKEASSLFFIARSRQTNSTLKHSRRTLALLFSVSHSLTLFFSSFFYLRCRWNCSSAAISIFTPLVICHSYFDSTSTIAVNLLSSPTVNNLLINAYNICIIFL